MMRALQLMDFAALKKNMEMAGWVCPHCRDIPGTKNFKVLIIETSVGTPVFNWISGERAVHIPPGTSGMHSTKELMVKRTVYQGCFKCLSKNLDSNVLAGAIFKAFWLELARRHPQMPNQAERGRGLLTIQC